MVDLYDIYFDKLILVVSTHFAITGAILSFYLAHHTKPKTSNPLSAILNQLVQGQMSSKEGTVETETPDHSTTKHTAQSEDSSEDVSQLIRMALFLPAAMSYVLGSLLIASSIGLVRFRVAIMQAAESTGAPRAPQVAILIASFASIGIIFIAVGVIITLHLLSFRKRKA